MAAAMHLLSSCHSQLCSVRPHSSHHPRPFLPLNLGQPSTTHALHSCSTPSLHICPHRRTQHITAAGRNNLLPSSSSLTHVPIRFGQTFQLHGQTSGRHSCAGPLYAKKGGGGGGGKKGAKGGKASPLANLLKEKEQQEQQEAAVRAAALATPEQHSSPEVLMYLMVLTQGYWQQAKEYLLEGADFSQLGIQVYDAPFGVIAQDKYSEAQAVSYANKAVLELLGGKWDDVVGVNTDKFAANKEATEDAFFSAEGVGSPSKPYEGVFVSLSGKKFTVKSGILFDINGPDGAKIGQGLKFAEVVWEDGTVQPLDPEVAAALEAEKQAAASKPATVEEAENWVKEQGDLVRTLKADKGLTNQDEEVIVAVEELLSRKEHLEKLKAAAAPA